MIKLTPEYIEHIRNIKVRKSRQQADKQTPVQEN